MAKGNLVSDKFVRRVRELDKNFGKRKPTTRQARQRKPPVVVQPFRFLLAKSGSNVTKGSSGTFTIYDVGSDQTKGSETATARTETAYVRVGDYTANKWAYLIRFPNGWEAFQTECAT